MTGHTGFKGSWLTLWLKKFDAKVIGISNSVPSRPSHFETLKLKKQIIHKKIDIRNLKSVKKFLKNINQILFSFGRSSFGKKILL